MSILLKSKRFHDTSRYHNHHRWPWSLETYSGYHTAEFKPNKANTYIIDTSFLDLNMKDTGKRLGSSSEKKGRDLTQSYYKSPYTNANVKRATRQHKDVNKKFDYSAIADRLRTVSWSNYSHPTRMGYRFYKAHLPTYCKSCVIEGKNMQMLL